MKSQLYLWNPLRQKYINDLSLIKNMFIERIQPVFSNAEQEAENYKRGYRDKSTSPKILGLATTKIVAYGPSSCSSAVATSYILGCGDLTR